MERKDKAREAGNALGLYGLGAVKAYFRFSTAGGNWAGGAALKGQSTVSVPRDIGQGFRTMVANSLSARRSGDGFSADMTGADARRQLRLSVGVVVVLAMGIVSAAVSVGSHPLAAKREVTSVVPTVVMHADAHPVGAKAI